MTPAHEPQLLKGVLSLLLSQLLAERESYGYEVVQRLDLRVGLPGLRRSSRSPKGTVRRPVR